MNIFLTVGTQLPFPRLIRHFIELIKADASVKVIAQTCEKTSYTGIQCFEFLPDVEYNKHFSSADIVVAHAGMGTVIQCIEQGKPLIIVPRNYSHGEHRNSHQEETARWLEKENLCSVVWDETRIDKDFLSTIFLKNNKSPIYKPPHIKGLIQALRDDILGNQ